PRRLVRRLFQDLEALDVALVLENARDVGLQPRGRHVNAGVLGGHRVANPREHICDWISHLSTLSYQVSADYQLLFVTPVMSPSSASFRKQRRQSANFRR